MFHFHISFHREKYVAAGGPDGGDGGKGGDIVFVADDNISNLIDFRFKRKYAAEKGKDGSGKNCTGRNAPDLVIKVPRGPSRWFNAFGTGPPTVSLSRSSLKE